MFILMLIFSKGIFFILLYKIIFCVFKKYFFLNLFVHHENLIFFINNNYLVLSERLVVEFPFEGNTSAFSKIQNVVRLYFIVY